MLSICPQCGISLKSEFNFCPNCGLDFSKLDRENFKEPLKYPEEKNAEEIICEECGAKNDSLSASCSVCGAALPSIKKKPSLDETKARQVSYKKPQQKKPAKREEPIDKTLSRTNILIIIVTVLVLAIVVLYFSGIFDEPAAAGNIPSTAAVPPQALPGTDLNLLNEINSLEEKAAAEPGNAELALRLANMQNDAGLFEKAIQTYGRYLELIPENADARIDMGVAYFNLKNYTDAEEQMERALKYEPNHQIGHLNLGIVNLQSGNLKASEEWLKKAVELDPVSEAGRRAKELLENHF